MYLDCNNLYGFAMSEPLPTGGFRFVEPPKVENFDLGSKSVDDSQGYLLEVDLYYPEHLDDAHDDYPWHPERLLSVQTCSRRTPWTWLKN